MPYVIPVAPSVAIGIGPILLGKNRSRVRWVVAAISSELMTNKELLQFYYYFLEPLFAIYYERVSFLKFGQGEMLCRSFACAS